MNATRDEQLSGIDPAGHLQEVGVTVAHDLPQVGRNLQDHFQARLAFRVKGPGSLNTRVSSLFGRAMMGAEFALRRTGPLTVTAGTAGLFARVLPGSETPAPLTTRTRTPASGSAAVTGWVARSTLTAPARASAHEPTQNCCTTGKSPRTAPGNDVAHPVVTDAVQLGTRSGLDVPALELRWRGRPVGAVWPGGTWRSSATSLAAS